MPRVNLRFRPENKAFIVREIVDSYAIEANSVVHFPAPNKAEIFLPSMFVAEELKEEAELSLFCEAYIDL